MSELNKTYDVARVNQTRKFESRYPIDITEEDILSRLGLIYSVSGYLTEKGTFYSLNAMPKTTLAILVVDRNGQVFIETTRGIACTLKIELEELVKAMKREEENTPLRKIGAAVSSAVSFIQSRFVA